jgi:hypothetical protein
MSRAKLPKAILKFRPMAEDHWDARRRQVENLK